MFKFGNKTAHEKYAERLQDKRQQREAAKVSLSDAKEKINQTVLADGDPSGDVAKAKELTDALTQLDMEISILEEGLATSRADHLRERAAELETAAADLREKAAKKISSLRAKVDKLSNEFHQAQQDMELQSNALYRPIREMENERHQIIVELESIEQAALAD